MYRNPVVKNPTRADAGIDGPALNTDRLSARLGGNTGNVAFIHAILKQIANIRHISDVERGYGDINVLGCSNQINPNIRKSGDDQVFANTQSPFVAIGLGAQAPATDKIMEIPEGTVDFIKRIQASAPTDSPNMTVRGEYTYAVLKKAGLHDRAVPLGCPSLFIHPNPKLGVILSRRFKRGIERVAVAPGNIFNPSRKYAKLEASLADLATAGNGGYILQHPKELMSLVRDGLQPWADEQIETIRATIQPDLDSDAFRGWFRSNARLFTSATSWMEYLRSVDLVVGTRIHGCMLAIQAGTPAVCLTLDSRQTELCSIMKLPHISASEFLEGVSLEQIHAGLAAHDWAAFDANRLDLATRYRQFLRNNMLLPSSHLEGLVRG